MHTSSRLGIGIFICALGAGCGTRPVVPSEQHIRAEAPVVGSIPPPVRQTKLLSPPKPAPKMETYSVVVNNVPAQELLFALARDAKLNVDVHPGITGTVTLNALDQTLPQLLSRIAKQVDMRYELEGQNLIVMPDTPFLRNYKVDYVNMSRNASANVSIATQIATTGGGISATGASASGSSGGNKSTTSVTNTSNNRFWETLVQNIKDMLHETDKILPESTETTVEQSNTQTTTGTGVPPPAPTRRSSSAYNNSIAASPNPATLENAGTTTTRRTSFREAASVIVNPESGIVAVRATSRQHEKIQQFLDEVMGSAQRQVLIEATIVEVTLNDQYQAGIDWSRIANGGNGITAVQSLTGANLSTSPTTILRYANPTSRLGNILVTIKLLEAFGNTRVLSSPKIMALNNQTALLKVVDEKVYFTTKLDITDATATTPEKRIYTSTINTVPVGVVMSVTPQISDNDTVSLNIRPTVSRITGYQIDPAPRLAGSTFDNLVPEIQVREMESLLKVGTGQTIILGGLMQDSVAKTTNGIPGLSRLPVVGDLFSYRNDTNTKTELVIFLRPIVIKEASLNGDLKSYRAQLPDDDFFRSDSQNVLDPSSKSNNTKP